MLKIKDNVDLKELEKFGFVKTYPYEEYFLIFDYSYDNSVIIYVPFTSKEICIEIRSMNEDCVFYPTNVLWLIFDLIQAGLVEKVVDNE